MTITGPMIDALLRNGAMCQSCAKTLTRAELEAVSADPWPNDPDRRWLLPLLLCGECAGRARGKDFGQWLDEEWEREHPG